MSKNSSNFLNSRVITKGPKEGHCRICKQYGKLTRDHIPPIGSIKVSDVELRTLAEKKNIKPTIGQGGTNFRTICGNCNNNLLGKQYDLELNKVSNQVGQLIKDNLSLSSRGFSLPPKASIKIKPQRLARAIIGHLLASNYHPNQSDINEYVPYPEALRDYFLDQNALLPDELNIYYWYYPGKRQVILHSTSMSCYERILEPISEPLIFSLVKFFPIAYWITWEEPKDIDINAPKLFTNRNIGIDHTEEIEIKLSHYPRIDFPERPDDDDELQYFLLINDQLTSVAIPKIKSKKKGFGRKRYN